MQGGDGTPSQPRAGCPLGRLPGLRGPSKPGSLRRWTSSGWNRSILPACGTQGKGARVQAQALAPPHRRCPVTSQGTQRKYSAGGAGNAGARRSHAPALETCSACPALSIVRESSPLRFPQHVGTLQAQGGALPRWGHRLPRKGPVSVPKLGCLLLNPDLEAGCAAGAQALDEGGLGSAPPCRLLAV